MDAADRSKLRSLGVADAARALQAGDCTSVQLAQALLDSIDASDLNSFIHVDPAATLGLAKKADKARSAGQAKGPLFGVPLAIKDNICTKGVATTAASKMLKDFVPPYESAVTQRLWDAGAFLLGKTNLDEFAMGSSNITSVFGPVINPWRSKAEPGQDRVPGGSSGGSAAAVAAFLAPAALGTDTGGSVRQPAAFCGLVALRPTYGRCPRWGIVGFASSLDQPGPMTRSVQDAALLMEVMAGPYAGDSTSSARPVPAYTKSLEGGVKGLRVGIPKPYKDVPVDPRVTQLWKEAEACLVDAGATIHEVDLPHIDYALQVYSIISAAEASSNFARYDGVRYGFRAKADNLKDLYQETRDQGFGDEVKRRIMTGTHVLSQEAYDMFFGQAQRVRRLIYDDFQKALEQTDVLLHPTAPEGAFAVDDISKDPTDMYRRDIFTITAALAGVPALAVPVGLDDNGLPLGLQLVGRCFDEETLFRASRVIEKAAQFPICPGVLS